jgi:hypothetical protein
LTSALYNATCAAFLLISVDFGQISGGNLASKKENRTKMGLTAQFPASEPPRLFLRILNGSGAIFWGNRDKKTHSSTALVTRDSCSRECQING